MRTSAGKDSTNSRRRTAIRIASSTYLAMLFYASGEYGQIRVMMNDAPGYDMSQGNVAFSDTPGATVGTAGEWTNVVPELTSGILLLPGSALLVLRRKQRR